MTDGSSTRRRRHAPHDPSKLRRIRIEAGYSQGRLAREAGLSQQLLSALECDDSGASPESLAKIAEVLGCAIADLLDEVVVRS